MLWVMSSPAQLQYIRGAGHLILVKPKGGSPLLLLLLQLWCRLAWA